MFWYFFEEKSENFPEWECHCYDGLLVAIKIIPKKVALQSKIELSPKLLFSVREETAKAT